MRKLIFFAFMVASSFTLYAQSLEDVQEKVNKGKYDEAKEKIDKLLLESKGQKKSKCLVLQRHCVLQLEPGQQPY